MFRLFVGCYAEYIVLKHFTDRRPGAKGSGLSLLSKRNDKTKDKHELHFFEKKKENAQGRISKFQKREKNKFRFEKKNYNK